MDNTRDLPGYKHYIDPETGRRPAIYVTYLDLARDDEATTRGVVFPVDPPALEELDRRERNYRRSEVRVEGGHGHNRWRVGRRARGASGISRRGDHQQAIV